VSADSELDLAVIGGGINGAGIARDAAGRGLRVALLERGDLGGATSSASSKLIHGGLRYLEHFEIRLVRESLRERELLLRNAPHVVRPQRFVLPHGKGLRPAWQVGFGLWLYDRLRGRSVLPGARRLDLARDPAGAPLRSGSGVGWQYADCVTDDARLVLLTARDAALRGCRVLPRTECIAARRDAGRWRITTVEAGGASHELRSRALVNAAGPWAGRVLGSIEGARSDKRLRLVKGSHVVVPRLYDGDQAFLLQNADRRVVFVIPFERDFTLIGTTEVVMQSPDDPVLCSAEETDYLCRAPSAFFARAVAPADVVWTFAGIRPLVDDGRAEAGDVTRDYVFELDAPARGSGAPLLSIFGGKLTTYRRLAERAVDKLRPWFPGLARPWTARAALPGGDFEGGPEALAAALAERLPRLPPGLPLALVRRHGTLAIEVMAGVRDEQDLGEHFGADLWEREVRWFATQEWAREVDDVLWRRTKCGLRLDEGQRQRVAACLARAIQR
jgi:glycerol-3-phosphate dehydrogenase